MYTILLKVSNITRIGSKFTKFVQLKNPFAANPLPKIFFLLKNLTFQVICDHLSKKKNLLATSEIPPAANRIPLIISGIFPLTAN